MPRRGTPLRVDVLLPAALLGAVLGVGAVAEAQPDSASGRLAGLTLEGAIAALEETGLSVFYSSALVHPDMRVAQEPDALEPRDRLLQVLAPFGLTARDGPRGSLLVTAGPEAQGMPQPRPRLAATARPQAPLRGAVDELTVVASRYEIERAVGAPAVAYTATELGRLPDLGDDALRAVQRVPGVAAHGFTARSHIRGGETNETLVRFDGLRLYDPYHFESFQGIFSAVDPRLIGGMQIYTGGFPAAFGDRSSGVVDLASLRPDEPRYHEVALSFFNASLLSAGRFGADAANEWVASVRRSNVDFLYDAFSDRPERPRYRDAFAKARFEVDDRLAVTLSVLYFRDDIELHDDLDVEEVARSVDEDRYGWLRLDHSFDDALHGTTLIARTRLDATRVGVTGKEGLATGMLADDRSFAVDSVQSEWSWRKSDALTLEFGGTAAKLRGQYDYRDAVEFGLLFDLLGAPQVAQRERSTALVASGRQYAFYGSARLRAGPRITADVGVRWDEQTLDAEGGTASPRLGLRYELGPSALLRMSLGRFYQSQAVNELRVADGELFFDAPQRSDHLVLGFERRFQRALSLRLELYRKNMSALRPRFENLANGLTLLPELKPDRIEIDPASAVARGLELSFESARDRNLSWAASYVWAEAEDRVAGSITPRAWDQTHTVNGAVAWRVRGWDLNVATVLRTGWPTTRLTLAGVRDGVPLVATARRNAERVGRYSSTDFRAARELQLGRAKIAAFAEIGNLFDHVNRCCTEYEIETEDDQTVLELSPIRYLPRVVSLGFIASF